MSRCGSWLNTAPFTGVAPIWILFLYTSLLTFPAPHQCILALQSLSQNLFSLFHFYPVICQVCWKLNLQQHCVGVQGFPPKGEEKGGSFAQNVSQSIYLCFDLHKTTYNHCNHLAGITGPTLHNMQSCNSNLQHNFCLNINLFKKKRFCLKTPWHVLYLSFSF